MIDLKIDRSHGSVSQQKMDMSAVGTAESAHDGERSACGLKNVTDEVIRE